MPYAKTKDGSLVNEVTLGDGYPLSNDLKPLKIGGEASILEISSPLPDGTDNGQIKVNGDLDITGTLKTKLSHDLIYDFDDEVNTLAQVKIDALIDSAPAALDTLNELAAALNDDASFSTTVTNSLATKLPLAGGTLTGDLIIAADNKIKSDTTGTNNFIEFDDDSGSPENQTIVSSVTNVALIVDGNGNDVGQFEILKAGTDSTATELFRIENDGDAVFTGNLSVGDNNITNVGDIALDTISSDAGTSIGVTLGTDAGDDFNVGSGKLVVEGDTGNVGIGTTSPTTKLHVEGSFKATGVTDFDNRVDINQTSFPQLRFSDDGGTDILDMGQSNEAFFFKTSDTNNNIRFRRSDNEDLLELDMSALRVGINTTSPTTTLDVEGTVSYKHTAFTTAGPTDNVDVSDTTVLEVDTSGGSVTIGGFTGGVQGQILYVIKTTSDVYTLKLENSEGGGSQDIFSSDNSDISIVRIRGGVTLYCNGTSWFVLNK